MGFFFLIPDPQQSVFHKMPRSGWVRMLVIFLHLNDEKLWNSIFKKRGKHPSLVYTLSR